MDTPVGLEITVDVPTVMFPETTIWPAEVLEATATGPM